MLPLLPLAILATAILAEREDSDEDLGYAEPDLLDFLNDQDDEPTEMALLEPAVGPSVVFAEPDVDDTPWLGKHREDDFWDALEDE